MIQTAKMRSECEQLNAQVRELVSGMTKEEQAMLYEDLRSSMSLSASRLNTIAYGLALCMFANLITNIAELQDANAP